MNPSSMFTHDQVYSSVHLRATIPENADGFGFAAISREAQIRHQRTQTPPNGSQKRRPSQEAQQRPREQNHRTATTHHGTG